MLKETDIRIDSYENGAGSNVKMIHIPTGISTKSHYHRSPFKARKEAMKELEQLVKDGKTKN